MNQMFSKTLFLTGLSLALSQAYALPLPPALSDGGSVSPVLLLPGTTVYPWGAPNGVSASGSSPFFQEDGSWSVGTASAPDSMNFDSATFIDPVTGDLDFFYQIQNNYNGATAANNTVASSYTLDLYTLPGVTITGVDQITSTNWDTGCHSATVANPNPPPPVCPDNFLDPTTGKKINSVALPFDAATGEYDDLVVTMNGTLTPGQNSAILVIQTNSTNFDQAGAGVFSWTAAPPHNAHSGTGANVNPFGLGTLEPILSPEPGVYGVLALGIAGLLLVVHRRSEKAKAKSSDASASTFV